MHQAEGEYYHRLLPEWWEVAQVDAGERYLALAWEGMFGKGFWAELPQPFVGGLASDQAAGVDWPSRRKSAP